MTPMNVIANILPYAQIILGVILIMSILLQQSGAGAGGALGGGDMNTFHSTRRGFEKFLFIVSVVCAILFVLSTLLAIIVKTGF
jgi:protein translocase SecG subunit